MLTFREESGLKLEVNFRSTVKNPLGVDMTLGAEEDRVFCVGDALFMALSGTYQGDDRNIGRKLEDAKLGRQILNQDGSYNKVELGDQSREHLKQLAFLVVPQAHILLQICEALGFDEDEESV